MPLVRYQVAVSIDGFIGPEDGSVGWLEGTAGGDEFFAFLKTIGGIVMGRASFELSLSFGPWDWTQPSIVMTSRPFADPLPAGVEAFNGDPAAALERLRPKMKGGDIWLFGGGVTAGQFLDAGLIDRLELAVIPVALGKGMPLFGNVKGGLHKFRPVKATPSDGGLVMLEYARA
ncbi:MAG TPA: dihydrofolate reductase family protein [Rhizomicrobium sp.]|nr:dihydrofolate reductase family protein [Rhizomicrobium sp.]